MGQGSVSKEEGEEEQDNGAIVFHANAESVDCPGSESVLSEPIGSMSPGEFWELLARDLRRREPRPPVRSYSSRALQGGRILVIKVVDTGGRLPSTTYTTWRLDPTADKATASDHGSDRTLCKVVRTTHVQAHRRPLRLELWAAEPEPCPEGEPPLQGAMEALIRDTLKSSVSCEAGATSPGGGRTCVLSDEVQDADISPQDLWAAVRGGVLKGARKVLPNGSVALDDPGTGFWRFCSDWPPASSASACWTKHVLDDFAYELHSHLHGADPAMVEESLEASLHLKIHWRPYRLEMWATLPPRRLAGEAEKAFALDLFLPLAEQAEERRRKAQAETAERAFLNEVREEISSRQDELRKELQALSSEVQELARVKGA